VRWDLFIIFVSGAIVALFFAALISYDSQTIPSESKISDTVLIDRTKELEEVKAILNIHNDPRIHVDRSEHFGVEYHISTTQLEGKPYDSDKDCLSTRVQLGYDGYPDSILDLKGTNRYELGDQNHIDFLKRGGECVFNLINTIPEGKVLNKTRAFEEVRAFLNRYPSATVTVQKLVNFEVSYGITRSEVTGEQWNKPGIPESAAILYMQLDRHLDLETIWLSCHINNGEYADVYDIRDKILDYLEKEDDCWDDDSLN
jgi:hypothetical protein